MRYLWLRYRCWRDNVCWVHGPMQWDRCGDVYCFTCAEKRPAWEAPEKTTNDLRLEYKRHRQSFFGDC